MKGYLTIAEVSEKWGIKPRRINTLCLEGRFDGEIVTLVTLKEGQWVFWDSTDGGMVFKVVPPPEKITLNQKKKVLKKGKEFKLELKKIVPKGAYFNVEYTSSNPKVATVDEYGNVKAKKAGTAVITVQSVIKKNVKATCVITVPSNKKPTPTPTKKPTATPTPTKQPTVTPTETPKPTVTPTAVPTTGVTATPTTAPSVTPVSEPSTTPITVPDEIIPTDTDITPTPETSEVRIAERDITVEPESDSEPATEPDVIQQGEENVIPTIITATPTVEPV